MGDREPGGRLDEQTVGGRRRLGFRLVLVLVLVVPLRSIGSIFKRSRPYRPRRPLVRFARSRASGGQRRGGRDPSRQLCLRRRHRHRHRHRRGVVNVDIIGIGIGIGVVRRLLLQLATIDASRFPIGEERFGDPPKDEEKGIGAARGCRSGLQHVQRRRGLVDERCWSGSGRCTKRRWPRPP